MTSRRYFVLLAFEKKWEMWYLPELGWGDSLNQLSNIEIQIHSTILKGLSRDCSTYKSYLRVDVKQCFVFFHAAFPRLPGANRAIFVVFVK